MTKKHWGILSLLLLLVLGAACGDEKDDEDGDDDDNTTDTGTGDDVLPCDGTPSTCEDIGTTADQNYGCCDGNVVYWCIDGNQLLSEDCDTYTDGVCDYTPDFPGMACIH